MKVAVVGATGMVGQKMLDLLAERNFPVGELYPVASEKSVGKIIEYQGKQYPVIGVQEAINNHPDVALFSAGGTLSREVAPLFAKQGTTVIDNSSAWRMDTDIPLVIPEVNGEILKPNDKIIANPNCSTIQMLIALAPIHRKFQINRLIISTYQSITGTGMKAVKQMREEREGKTLTYPQAYPYSIDQNCIPHCDSFTVNGYTKEEMKLVNETQKILNDNSIKISATAVRIPVMGGHSESINIELEKKFSIQEIRTTLQDAPGIIVCDKPEENLYPMPTTAYEKDEVFVGRIRQDLSHPQAINLWVVSDNIRKGAATNAIQIAELLIEKGWL